MSVYANNIDFISHQVQQETETQNHNNTHKNN